VTVSRTTLITQTGTLDEHGQRLDTSAIAGNKERLAIKSKGLSLAAARPAPSSGISTTERGTHDDREHRIAGNHAGQRDNKCQAQVATPQHISLARKSSGLQHGSIAGISHRNRSAMSRNRNLVCREYYDADPDGITELAACDLPAPDLAAPHSAATLHNLEATALEVGCLTQRTKLQAQGDAAGARFVLAYLRRVPAGQVRHNGWGRRTAARRVDTLRLEGGTCRSLRSTTRRWDGKFVYPTAWRTAHGSLSMCRASISGSYDHPETDGGNWTRLACQLSRPYYDPAGSAYRSARIGLSGVSAGEATFIALAHLEVASSVISSVLCPCNGGLHCHRFRNGHGSVSLLIGVGGLAFGLLLGIFLLKRKNERAK
jgi:hypothetical protein